ncbi:DUF3068 domain-containing protein [Rhodococcus sp. C26F]
MSIGARPTPCIVASLAVLIGAFLLTVSVLIPTYAVDRLVKIPLTVEADTVSTGTATLLDSTELMQGRLVLEDDVPITVNQRVTVEDPSDKDVVTLQSAIRMTRDDRSGTAAIVNASVDRSTLDRTTALPVDEPVGSLQTETGKVPEPVVHDGLQFKFPFDTQKQSYPYFDTTFKQSRDVHFVEETELDGLLVYRFRQEVEPTQVGGGISLPASVWGREGNGSLKLPRFYSITRDLWVEPVSGAVVQVEQHHRQFFAAKADDPEAVTLIDVTPRLDEQTQAEQIAFARTSKSLVLWGTVYAPIGAAVAGVALLASGIYLGVRTSRRDESVRPTDMRATVNVASV